MNELTKEQAEEAWLHAVAIISGKHSTTALEAEFGSDPPDDAIDLATVAPGDIEDHLWSKVLPTPAIAKYLASGDPLTDDAINRMEESMETAYGIAMPLFILAEREGKEGNNLRVKHFRLFKEEKRQPYLGKKEEG